MSKEKREQLFSILKKQGWYWEGETLYAPNKYFSVSKKVSSDMFSYRNQMLSRMHRLIANKDYYENRGELILWKQIVDDTAQLAKALDFICDDGGLEAFFARISEPLERFASKHNLLLTKYYHGEPSWDFIFRHPKGGAGRIEIVKATYKRISIYNIWWLDDYDKFTRFIKGSEMLNINLDLINLEKLLEESINFILLWDLGTWDGFNSGFKEAWSIWSKEEFEKLLNRFPIPIGV